MKIIYLLLFVMLGSTTCLADSSTLRKSGHSEAEVSTRGTLLEISSESLKVGSHIFLLTSQTKFEANDVHVALDFFKVGDYVKVEGRNVQGVLTASEVELESEHTGGGSDDSGGDSSDDNNSGGSGDDSNSGNDDESEDEELELSALLSPNSGDPAAVLGRGKARYESETEGRKSERKLTIQVKRKYAADETVPATAPAVNASLIRNSVEYADCTLKFDRYVTKYGKTYAEYKLDLREKVRRGLTTLRSKKGSCDLNLSLEDSQNGLPDIASGDQVLVFETDSENVVSQILEGDF